MKKLNHKNWKRICSCILAVCLIGSLVLANQSFGVFAEKTEEEVTTEQGEKTETTESTEKKAEEETTKDKDNTQSSTEAKSTETKIIESVKKSTQIGLQTTNEETTVQEDTISDLINADETLLKWKAEKEGNVTVSVNDKKYNASDDASYTTAYDAVYSALENQATIIDGNISKQTISTDKVWYIPDGKTVSLDGNITVEQNARLVILGNGTIKKSGSYAIVSNGTLYLQGKVFLDGNEKETAMVQVQAGKAYLADDFRIGNNNGNGLKVTNAEFYMVGGVIGTKNISFDWYGEENTKIDTKSYEDTFDYITKNINGDSYNYIKTINSTGGNTNSGVLLSKKATFYISDGNISGNGQNSSSTNSGGAINASDNANIIMTGGYIIGNQVKGSGGALSTGSKTKMTFSDGMIIGNYSNEYAGGINAGGTLDLKQNAVVAYNGSRYNGGGILVSQDCVCTMSGKTSIVHNRAIGAEKNSNSGKGGAFRVVGTLNIEGGEINYNYGNGPYNSTSVDQDVGGAISAQTDRLDTGAVRIATVNLKGGEIAYNKANGRGGAIWMASVATDYNATFSLNGTDIHDNTAKSYGGAIYLEARAGTLQADLVSGRLSNNESVDNGGGIYMTLTSSAKALTVNIGNKDVDNKILDISKNETQRTGGGLYISKNSTNNTGTINVNLYSGTLKDNKAVKGGAIGVVKGNLNVNGGGFNSNAASENGGGAYVEEGEVNITKGTFKSNQAENGGGAYLSSGSLNIFNGTMESNKADYGAGAYVADGKIRMFGGNISGNEASQDGGGMYVSSINKAADIVIRSGSLTKNMAGSTNEEGNGGAIAVASNNSNNQDHVIIGLREKHQGLNIETRKFNSFEYADNEDDNTKHTHESCPEITGNKSYGNGGGIYMNSKASILDIYCLLEDNNTSIKDITGGSIMSEGGTVNIGDIGEDETGNNTPDAVGNIFIKSPMLVKGGIVNLYGNTENPKFADKILVDIQENAGEFHDYRYTKMTNDINYKIEYFENFEGSGIFTSMQYGEDEEIKAMGNMYEHEGYTILGWDTNPNAKTPKYKTGAVIGDKDNHNAWENLSSNGALELYAIWKKVSYTVVYEPNATEYEGTMENQTFDYGETKELLPNAYKIKGKHFVNWNTQADGNGTTYQASYDESMISKTEGATVTLYAQWVNCTHKGGDSSGILSYEADQTNHTITENCDCGGHTAMIKLSGASVYYDGKEHSAMLQTTGDWLADKPDITYTYNSESPNNYGTMPENTSKPTKVGYYKATFTVENKTISVEYQIKSQAESVTIEAIAKKGQHFVAFNNDDTCTVANDDAFTVQYNVQSLNRAAETAKGYKTAPVLTLDKELPAGTTIIMQAEDRYWYNDNPTGKEIALTSFKEMGAGDVSFVYYNNKEDEIKDAQTYRFVIDFSKVEEDKQLNGKLNVGLRYAYTDLNTSAEDPDQNKEEKAVITIQDKPLFTITSSTDSTYQIQAPLLSNITDTRWERKNLVWEIMPKVADTKLPSDAKLIILTTIDGKSQTAIYSLNANGEFVIPMTWTGSSNFIFALSSEQESVSTKNYELTAALCIGSKVDQASQPAAIEDQMQKTSADISLSVPQETEPALKIIGTERVLSKSDKLNVNIDYKNIVDGSIINAVIQKKAADGKYGGKYGETTITKTGNQGISLAPDTSGSYRLLVSVSSSTGQTLLEVPYYFIIQ